MLLGNDYFPGIAGIGAVMAGRLIAKYKSIKAAESDTAWGSHIKATRTCILQVFRINYAELYKTDKFLFPAKLVAAGVQTNREESAFREATKRVFADAKVLKVSITQLTISDAFGDPSEHPKSTDQLQQIRQPRTFSTYSSAAAATAIATSIAHPFSHKSTLPRWPVAMLSYDPNTRTISLLRLVNMPSIKKFNRRQWIRITASDQWWQIVFINVATV